MDELPTWRTRERETCLTQKDLKAFTEIVRHRHPKLYIYECKQFPRSFRELTDFGDGDRIIEFSPTRPRRKPMVSRVCHEGELRSYIKNLPTITLEIRRRDIETLDLRSREPTPHTHRIDAVVRRLEPGGMLRGTYRTDNEHWRRFVQSVFYLAGKFMTNDFDVYDLETREHHHTFRKSTLWAGPDAMRLGETDPDFYCTVYFDTDLNTWLGYKAIPRVRGKKRK